MTSEKLVSVLVHGAYHLPHFCRKPIEQLRRDGYVVLAPAHDGHGTSLDNSIADNMYVDDEKRIHETPLPHLHAGRESVLVCHSQRGIAGSAATAG
ncbi:hypothetical protein BKA67DRAFT_543884 [Truncatella angustata]|uniref:Uncharacterized protein n=1 Tax=Truncatella angustata TaxID=152316 RepID=A0A9P8UW13_9PEZI|nr:uncharacterized protein BKA67DRAFT_543884 [Truncatella angustata]KAH6659220.1 hypothetical protein BKA67DRAFT_543884 [Truncatella angustata]KAH8198013.1 hypothetical protein TruAng_007838 [Truncatella angustata]